uniref:Putative killer plasmid pGKl-2 protein 1 n=1 Tax=Talaromyces marneffei PM1 TaxID=1077442 RepID=A0A093V921_TALMA
MVDKDDNDMRDRLRSLAFNMGEARDALRGKTVPKSLGRRVTRLCVIRGIRYHEQFAEHPDLEQMRQYVPEISRALNARAIMSNKIPSMPEARDRPYCIWHPEVASEDTYRKLWQQYPDMAYQVGRACAVANYVELYLEMDLLPDSSIAEEARASGSTEVFEAIMRKPMRYRIMNDYTRKVTLQNPELACLNDDTAVVSTLDIKQRIRKPCGFEEDPIFEAPETWEEATALGAEFDDMDEMYFDAGFDENMFNITEDMNVGEVNSEKPKLNYLPELLVQPLPVDLPPGNKDVLILMAAYYGNIERYSRLRRPRVIDGELGCLVRGIYHNSMFAVWCATQTIPSRWRSGHIMSAIHARMIMNNDLSRIVNLDKMQPHEGFEHMPYMIWFPNKAKPNTYKTLASAVTKMRPSVLHAAVYTGDKTLFDWLLDDLGVAPTRPALQEARVQNRGKAGDAPSYFVTRLEARSQELGIDLDAAPVVSWKMYSAEPNRSGNWLAEDLTPDSVHSAMEDWGFYDGYIVDASGAELFASAPESWRPGKWKVELDYEEWPKRGGAQDEA